MSEVLSPCAGRVLSLADVPDPVFASEMVGPGVAVDPGEGRQTIVAPVAGKLVKLHPHAFVVLTSDGVGILVHLGIDTVKLEGRGFELVAEEGATLAAGDPVVHWDPATIEAGMSPVVPVVVMDRPAGSVTRPEGGTQVAAGDPLFTA